MLTISIRDREKLIKIQDELVKRVQALITQMGAQAPLKLDEFDLGGGKGYSVQFQDLPIPAIPSWVVTKDQFIVGQFPPMLTNHLANLQAGKSLADNALIKQAFLRDPKMVFLSYRDTKSEIQQWYSLIEQMTPTMTMMLSQSGIDFHLPALPPLKDLEPYLAPSIMTASRNSSGWVVESQSVLPSMTGLSVATVGIVTALALPAVQQAREAARRTQSQNNLKQIALAMYNYHETTYRRFPERVVLDKSKKPGLSWRVKILPLLGEGDLYIKTHLR